MASINGYITPIVNYKSIKINNQDITLSTICKASFTSPYNRIDFVINSTNVSLSYYEVRITREDDNYDIGIGVLAYWDTNIQNNVDYSFSINVNSINFNYGDGTYRISLYAKNAIDGSWDVAYLLFTVNNDQFVTNDASDGFEVLTDVAQPSDAV